MRLRLATERYGQVLDRLRASYDDSAAARRDATPKADWKVAERSAFLDRLRAARARTLLEIGCGSGQDSAWFQDEGLEVTAVDLSPAMVSLARAKGVRAEVRDLLHLGFPGAAFDAVYSVNTLLHVPNSDLDAALRAVRDVLAPGGLFFLGVFGGEAEEGIAEDDQHDPPRFFSFRTDEQLQAYAAEHFECLDFHTLATPRDFTFQSMTLVRP